VNQSFAFESGGSFLEDFGEAMKTVVESIGCVNLCETVNSLLEEAREKETTYLCTGGMPRVSK
jgi:hypothetical protein